MDLQTADGLLHRLSSCCIAGGQYNPTVQSCHMIVTAGADYSKYTDTITTDFPVSGKESVGFSLHTAIKNIIRFHEHSCGCGKSQQ